MSEDHSTRSRANFQQAQSAAAQLANAWRKHQCFVVKKSYGRAFVCPSAPMPQCPNEWRLGDINKPLDKITVRDLTGALTRAVAKPPSCFKKWQRKFPGLDLRGVSERYSMGIATPVDFGSHSKLIVHSGFLTNPHNPDAASPRCRLCGQTRESIEHCASTLTAIRSCGHRKMHIRACSINLCSSAKSSIGIHVQTSSRLGLFQGRRGPL